MKYSISIIIPVMGRVNDIRQFANSFRPLVEKVNEIIIIDDNSKISDSIIIRDICKKNKFKYYKNYKNFGPAKSKNIGAKLSKSRYLWFLDSGLRLRSFQA